MSFLNLIARIFVVAVPMVAELPDNLPIIIYTTICGLGIVVSLFFGA
jgi:hypothetical protein